MNLLFVPLMYAIKLQTNKRKYKACICTTNTCQGEEKLIKTISVKQMAQEGDNISILTRGKI